MVGYTIDPAYLSSTCEIKSMDNSTLLRGALSDITDESITITQDNDTMLILHYNQKVKVNIHNNKMGFLSIIGTVYTSTRESVKLIELDELSHFEKRDYFRVKVSLDGLVSKPSKSDSEEVRIENISLNGVLFSGHINHNIGDILNVQLYSSQGLLKFTCTVRRIIASETSPLRKYGCEFDKYSDKIGDALWRYILQVEREEIRKLRGM